MAQCPYRADDRTDDDEPEIWFCVLEAGHAGPHRANDGKPRQWRLIPDDDETNGAKVMPTCDDLQSKLSGLHFAQESLTNGEREILHLAEAMLKQREAELLAATQEVERLTRERDDAARNALAETIVSVKHEREANDAIALVVGERDEARSRLAAATAEIERLRARVERLRRLVGEACDYAEGSGDKRRPYGLTQADEDRLAAIRHAAEVEGKGE